MYDEAEPLYQRSLTIFEKGLGAHDPIVATTLEQLAALYRATDQNDKAVKLERRAAAIRVSEPNGR